MTKDEAERIMTALVVAYPQAHITEASISLYTAYLALLPYRLASEMVSEWIGEQKWLPTIAEIVAGARKRAEWDRLESGCCRGCEVSPCFGCEHYVPATGEIVRRLMAKQEARALLRPERAS